MNNKQQIEELKKVNQEQTEKIKQLESQINQECYLQPGDICEVWGIIDDPKIMYYSNEYKNEHNFVDKLSKVGYVSDGERFSNYKKLNTYTQKILEGWMATDKNLVTHVFIEYPHRINGKWMSVDQNMIIDFNDNGQTFDDEPVKVAIVELLKGD